MGFPIAYGAKTVSSRPIALLPEPVEVFADDDDEVVLKPVSNTSCRQPLLAMATSSNQELAALVTITYYDMIRDNDESQQMRIEYTTAEIRIQISPLAQPFSSNHRETIHRIALPESAKLQHKTNEVVVDGTIPQMNGSVQVHSITQPSVVFSSDGRHLACLVPHPPQLIENHDKQHDMPGKSTVVVFQLRKPRSRSTTMPAPTRPSYLPSLPDTSSILAPVATNPRIVHGSHLLVADDLLLSSSERMYHEQQAGGDEQDASVEPLLIATAICDVSMSQHPAKRAGSVLLAGCADGSIFVIGYRSGRIAGRLFSPNDEESISCDAIQYMTHITVSSRCGASTSLTQKDQTVKGRLVAIRSDGRASIFQSHLHLNTGGTSTATCAPAANDGKVTDGFTPEKKLSVTEQKDDVLTVNGDAVLSHHDHVERDMNDSLSKINDIQLANLPLPASIRRREGSHGLTGIYQQQQEQQQQQQEQRHLLMHLDQLCDLEGPFLSATWINGCLLATLPDPFVPRRQRSNNHSKAQVWTIPNIIGVGQLTEIVVPQHPLACLEMTESRLTETAHVAHHFELPHDDDNDNESVEALWDHSFALYYDEFSGCLAISSVVMEGGDSASERPLVVRPFSCIWHWRTNVVGFTTTTPDATLISEATFLAQLYFGFDPERGHDIVHFSCAVGAGQEDECRIYKTSYSTALLSPAQCVGQSGWCVAEPNPLMLSPSTVTFPYASNPMYDDAVHVEWKESSIPANYTAAYGHTQLAAIARVTGRYVAVAASRGMCILDYPRVDINKACQHESRLAYDRRNLVHRQSSFSKFHSQLGKPWKGMSPRWRFFGSEVEERAFQVLAMTWWEGVESVEAGVGDQWTESLIVAVVQSGQSSEAESGKQHRYLACWSPRRLDVDHQLIQPAQNSLHPFAQWGIPLPDDLVPSSLTLLTEPIDSKTSSIRKAVVLVSAATAGSDGETGIRYAVYQLQLHVREGLQKSDALIAPLPFCVLSRCGSNGEVRLCDQPATSAIVCGIFLAGAAFTYDLTRQDKDHKIRIDGYICTLGILRSPGGGLHAVAVTTAGATVAAPVLVGGTKVCDVSMYFLSDVILGGSPGDGSDRDATESSYHAWTIERADGQMFCWFVPSKSGNQNEVFYALGTMQDRTKAGKSNLSTPALVFGTEVENDARGYLLGSVCAIGDATTWMQESLSTNRSIFLLGAAPNSSFGCMMGVGQSSRTLHRVIDGFDHESFAKNVLDIDCLALGDLVLFSPLFVTSLYGIFVEAARVHAEFNPGIDGCQTGSTSFIRSAPSNHARRRLMSNPNNEMVMMALRLLVIRAVEFVATEVRTLEKLNNKSMSLEFVLAMSLFAEVVDAVRACTNQLQFASLFLEVGRQIEPSYSCHLFPLPVPIDAYGTNINDYKYICSVDDLFGLSLKEGSLSVAASALPLFATRRQSREICVQLLRHCLLTFQENIITMESVMFDVSCEERRFINDILQFGLRLEDVDSRRVVKPTSNGHATNGGVEYLQEFQKTPSSHKRVIEPSFLRFLPSWFYDSGTKREEKEIYDAASSFILLGFEESTYEYIEREREKDEAGVTSDEDPNGQLDDTESIAGVVARSLLALVFESKGAHSMLKWKRTAALARLLLGEHNPLTKDQTMDCADVLQEVELHEMELMVSNNVNAAEEDIVVRFLVFRILECSHECDPGEADLLLDLILLLLQRYDISHDLDVEIPGLLLIGVIAAHVADRSDSFVGQLQPSCPISNCYDKVCDELKRTV